MSNETEWKESSSFEQPSASEAGAVPGALVERAASGAASRPASVTSVTRT